MDACMVAGMCVCMCALARACDLPHPTHLPTSTSVSRYTLLWSTPSQANMLLLLLQVVPPLLPPHHYMSHPPPHTHTRCIPHHVPKHSCPSCKGPLACCTDWQHRGPHLVQGPLVRHWRHWYIAWWWLLCSIVYLCVVTLKREGTTSGWRARGVMVYQHNNMQTHQHKQQCWPLYSRWYPC